MQRWVLVLAPCKSYTEPPDTQSLSASTGTKAPSQAEQNRLGPEADNWDSWNTTWLPHHQQIRGRSHTLQTSLQTSIKTVPWKLLGSSGLLSMSQSFNFSTPNFNISVCLTSLCTKHTNLGSTRKKKKDVTGSAEHWWSRLGFGWKDVLEMRYWGKPLTSGTNERADR